MFFYYSIPFNNVFFSPFLALFPAFPQLKPPQRHQQVKPSNRSSLTATATATRRPASAEIIRPNRNKNTIKEKAATNPVTSPNKDSKTEEEEIITRLILEFLSYQLIFFFFLGGGDLR